MASIKTLFGQDNIGGERSYGTLPSIGVQGETKLNAVERLTAMPIAKGENYFQEYFELDLEKIKQFNQKPKHLGSKSGVDLYLANTGPFSKLPTFFLIHGYEYIGELELKKTAPACIVEVVYLVEEWRGKGLGIWLYEAAIQQYHSICSSTSIGTLAIKTWKKLAQSYNVRLISLETNKTVPYTWGPDDIPIVDGDPINRGRNEKRYFLFWIKK